MSLSGDSSSRKYLFTSKTSLGMPEHGDTTQYDDIDIDIGYAHPPRPYKKRIDASTTDQCRSFVLATYLGKSDVCSCCA